MNFLKSFKSALTSVKSWMMHSADQNFKVLGRTWQSMRMVDKLDCPQSQLQGAPILGQLATIICPPILHQSKRPLDAHDNTVCLNQPLVQNCGVASGKQLQGAPMLSHSPILYSFSIKVEVNLCVWRREDNFALYRTFLFSCWDDIHVGVVRAVPWQVVDIIWIWRWTQSGRSLTAKSGKHLNLKAWRELSSVLWTLLVGEGTC